MYKLHLGKSPLVISIPHAGLVIPEQVKVHMTQEAARLVDTDWFVDKLYEFAKDLDVTIIAAELSRYVIDLNRDPDGVSLYPGQFTTGLCPLETFDKHALYKSDYLLDEQEVAHRRQQYWQPYHDEIIQQTSRVRALHGHCVLLDGHSIASEVPTLFDGQLPDLNFGTFNGASADEDLADALNKLDMMGYSSIFNGRFKGGYITRHYGKPEQSIHAIQLEISQATYLNESNRQWHSDKASALQAYLKQLCHTLIHWKPATIKS